MADQTIDPELIQKLTDEVKKLGIGFSKLADSIEDGFKKSSTEQARDRQNLFRRLKDSFTTKGSSKFTKSVEQAIEGTANSLEGLGRSADRASSSLENFSKTINGSGLNEFVGSLRSASKEYDSLASMGSTLTGNLLGLGDISAKTADAMKGFATRIDQSGDDNSPKVRLSLRNAVLGDVEGLRSFGMSLGLAETILSRYTETLASGAKLDELSDNKISLAITELARNANAVAGALGSNSETVLRITSAQQASADYRAKLSQMSADEQLRYVSAMNTAVMALAAQGGEAGTTFSRMLVETASTGNAAMSQAGKMFVNAGLHSVIGSMNQLATDLEKASPADAVRLQAEFVEKFQKEAANSLDALEKNASAGNDSAKQTLAILSKTQKLSAEAMAKVRAEINKSVPKRSNVPRISVVPPVLMNSVTPDGLRTKKPTDTSRPAPKKVSKIKKVSRMVGNTIETVDRVAKGDHDRVINGFKQALGIGIAAKLTSIVIDHFQKNLDGFRNLLDVGVSFSGGVMDMTRSANNAGLTLAMFSEMVEKNAALAAAMSNSSKNGAEQLGTFTRQVREQSRSMGNFGYTIEGLNEVSAEYLSTVRLARNVNNLTSEEQQKLIGSVQDFARDIMAGSALYGKNRKEIMRDSLEAQRNEIFLSRSMGANAEELTKKFGKAISFFASIPTEFGKKLTTGLAETIGFGAGTAVFSEVGRMLADTGMGHLVPVIDGLAKNLQEVGEGTGDGLQASVSAFRNIVGEIGQNEDALKLQALAGNTSAREMLRFYNETKNLNEAQIQERMSNARNMDKFSSGLTNGLLTIRDRFLAVTSKFQGMFLDWFGKFAEGVSKGLEDFTQKGGWDRVFASITSIFKSLGKLMGIDFEKMSEVSTTGIAIGEAIDSAASGIERFAKYLEVFSGNSNNNILTLISTGITTLVSEMPKLTLAMTVLAGAAVTIAGFMAKGYYDKAKNFFGGNGADAGDMPGKKRGGPRGGGLGLSGIVTGLGVGTIIGEIADDLGRTSDERFKLMQDRAKASEEFDKKYEAYTPSGIWQRLTGANTPVISATPATPTTDAAMAQQAALKERQQAIPAAVATEDLRVQDRELLKEVKRLREAVDGQTMFLGEQQRQGNRISQQQNRILSDGRLTRE